MKIIVIICAVGLLVLELQPTKGLPAVDFTTLGELDRTMAAHSDKYYEGTRRGDYPVVVMDTVYPIERAFQQWLKRDFAVRGKYAEPSRETVLLARMLLGEFEMRNK